MLESFIELIFSIGYLGFFIYMVLVGTFIPLPTQLILLPAGYLVSQGKLDFTSVLIVSSLGITLGATFNYTMAHKISKKFMERDKIDKVQKFFNKYGKLSVALAPLTFGLGQYISIPAGMAKMDLRWFLPLIFLSNMLWNATMLMLGYTFGESISSTLSYSILSLALLIVILISSFVYREFKSY